MADRTCPFCGAGEVEILSPNTLYACGTTTYDDRPGSEQRSAACLATAPTPATEAPTAPSEPDEGAASPVGAGEAVRPRVGAWRKSVMGSYARLHPGGTEAAMVRPNGGGWCSVALRETGVVLACPLEDPPTLDAAKAAADAALEAAGYVLEGGAHVDPGAPQTGSHVLIDGKWIPNTLPDPPEADDHRRALVLARGDGFYAAEVWPDSLEHGRRNTGATLAAALKAGLERALRVVAEVRRG